MMPTEAELNAAKVEAILSRALEAAQDGNPDESLPEEVQAEIRAMADLTPEDLGGTDEEEMEDEPDPGPDDDTVPTAPFALKD